MSVHTQDPEILNGLVASLHNLGIQLRAMQRHQEAEAAAQEAVDICRKLTAQEQAYQPRLADALNGLAIAKARIARPDESAAAANEAVTLYRALHQTQPSTYRRRLASALTNHADAARHTDPDWSAALLTEARNLCDPTTDTDLTQHIDTIRDALGHTDAHDP